MKSLLVRSLLLSLLLPFPARAAAAENPNGPAQPGSQVAAPADIADIVRLEAERAAIRAALIAELKAAEKAAVEAARTQGQEAGTAIHAQSIAKQQAKAARLQEIETQLKALRPEAKATNPKAAQ